MNILSLTIKNSYAHKNTTIKFADGVNYILGKNESGKSEALEMISYALFGTSALRSAASEYKTLEVTMTFKVGETTYIVDRSKKTTLVEVVIEEDDVKTKDVATSKTAVNQAIIDLLGYNLDVFNKLNFSKQLEGSAFANSTKGGRLELINKINGVDEANSLETFLDKKRKSLKSEIKGLSLTDNLKNINFKPNKEFDKLGEDALKQLSEESVKVFQSISTSERMMTAYSMIPCLDTKLQALAEEIEAKRYLSPIDGKEYAPEEFYSIMQTLIKERDSLDLEIQKGDAYKRKHAFYSKAGNGLIEEWEVQDEEAIIANNKLCKQRDELLAKGDITCPHCLAEFPLMTKALEAFADLGHIYSPHDYTEAEVIKARQYINLHDKTIREFVEVRESLVQKEAYLTEITDQTVIDAVYKEIQILRDYKNQKASYDKAMTQFKTQFGDCLDDIPDLQKTLDKDRELLNEISSKRIEIESYQKEKAVYNSAKDAQEKLEAFVKERTEKIDAFENLIDESKRIKLEIQNSCIPTLNKKASQVINKMTGGEHFSLTLSDTFELLLDGKSITAYSGSAQVTANVAFRIALIEMFYKKSFPLFIGDEIDSFADATRASHIHESLKVLAEEGYQVILISHHALSFEGNIIDLNTLKKK